MKKIISLFFVSTLVFSTVISGCAKPETALTGTWKMTQNDGNVIWFTFSSDNTLNVNNEIWLHYFVTKDKKLILGEEEPAPYSIKNNTLRIEQEGLTLVLIRQKSY